MKESEFDEKSQKWANLNARQNVNVKQQNWKFAHFARGYWISNQWDMIKEGNITRVRF